jgi:hypothetical protein
LDVVAGGDVVVLPAPHAEDGLASGKSGWLDWVTWPTAPPGMGSPSLKGST